MKEMRVSKLVLLIAVVLFGQLLSGCKSEGGDVFECEINKPTVTVKSITDASCNTSDGSFELEAQGTGELTFKIELEVNQDNVFNNFPAGKYNVQVIDENGCFETIEVTVGTLDTDLSSTVSIEDDAGCGTSNGQIAVLGVGGEGGFTYSLDGTNFQSSGIFTGLAVGDYTIVIKDNSGCTTTNSVLIANGVSYSLNVKSIIQSNCAVPTCHNGDNGTSIDWTVFSNVKSKAVSIKSKTRGGSMPPSTSGFSLTQQEIDLIACWVDDGAKNN